MKKINIFLLLSALTILFACTTKDVTLAEGEKPNEDDFYEITDAAFGDYLIRNTNLPADDVNKLPYGTAFLQEGKRMINKKIAATAKIIYLVKDNTRMGNLETEGIATAREKIANLDGIQFFTGAEEIRLTSNVLTGKLDLSVLTNLKTLEMNSNYVSELIVPASLTRLRYAASTSESAPDNRWLTTIDLSKNANIDHIHLPNHKLTVNGFVLPENTAALTYIDVSGNVDVPFEIPATLFNQLTTKEGVISENTAYTGPKPERDYYAINDLAFGEYLVYLTEKETDADIKLPQGTAFKHTDNKIYINKAVAATAKILNASKSGSFITKLTNAGVASSEVKIADADGLQFFTALEEITFTSNAFTEALKLNTLTKLKSLIVRTAGLSLLDVSANTELERLDIQGSTRSDLNRLKAADLKNNTKLTYVNLSANEIAPASFVIPSQYPALTTLNMKNNKVNDATVTYTVPATLYDQLGSGSDDKAGLVRGQ